MPELVRCRGERTSGCESEQQPVGSEFADAVEVVDEVQLENGPERDEYAVDEAHLKELEALMTEEERNDHHSRSLETKKEGNALFVEQKWEEAAKCYTRALLECPPSFADVRAIFYSNRAACFIKMEQNEEAVSDCSKAIEADSKYAKAYFRRAQLYEMKEDTWDKALDDYQTLLRMQPDDKIARAAIVKLPPMIAERNERMKADMINKLKDLGNIFLRPFGLSTENFKLEQNAEGGYSVQMKK